MWEEWGLICPYLPFRYRIPPFRKLEVPIGGGSCTCSKSGCVVSRVRTPVRSRRGFLLGAHLPDSIVGSLKYRFLGTMVQNDSATCVPIRFRYDDKRQVER